MSQGCYQQTARSLTTGTNIKDRRVKLKTFHTDPALCSGKEECTLVKPSGEKVVLKRSHSCGAGHVKVVDSSVRTGLKCFNPPAKHLTSDPNPMENYKANIPL